VDAATPWGAVIVALLLFIPLHELLHAAWHPQWGLSPQTVLVAWPAKLCFGVYYEGCMAQRRWLLVRFAPLLFLSVLPAGLLGLFHWLPVAFAPLLHSLRQRLHWTSLVLEETPRWQLPHDS